MIPWLIVAGDFTPLGGMDRANHELAGRLAGEGRDVHLVAHRVSPDLLQMPNVTVHYARRPMGAHLIGAPLLARAAARAARRLGPSLHVLSNGGNADGAPSTWIHYLHAAYLPDAIGRTRLSAVAGRRYHLSREREAIQRARTIICNSERTADDVGRHYAVPTDRLKVMYYGVDAGEFSAVSAPARAAARAALEWPSGRPVALFIGALGDRRKGFDVLFDAWQIVSRESDWDVDLAVAGSGAELPRWRQRARAAGLADRVRFLGFRNDIPEILAACDVLVHPARYEAYGLGVHEALCRGLPAIVTASAGVAERYPDALRPLLLPAPPSAAAVAERLRSWRREMACWTERAGRFGVDLRRRSWAGMADDIAGLVEHA